MKLNYPAGCFNLKEIYLLTMDDCCNITGIRNVWWKDRFQTQGNGKGYTSRNHPDNEDPFIESYTTENQTNLYWYNVVNGVIHFSDSCADFTKVKVVYNGVMGTIGETPFIPRFFRQAVKGWVVETAYRSLVSRDPRKYATLYDRANIRLNAPYDGLWAKAKQRIDSLDSKMMSDLKEYLCSMNT
jgi:hypothetical protein